MGSLAGQRASQRDQMRGRLTAARWMHSTGCALALALVLLLLLMSDSPPPAPDHECRFWSMIGVSAADSLFDDQLVGGTHSLKTLGDDNPNGWGLAYFSPPLQSAGWEGPALVRGGPPANHAYDSRYDDAVARMLALDPTCAIVHLRYSSGAHTGVPDPQPFWRDGLALAHNGRFTVTDVVALLEADDPDYLDTHPPDYTNAYIDTELMLLYILKLREVGVDLGRPATADEADGGRSRSHALPDVISRAILRIYDTGAIVNAANCVVTTGDTLIGVRFDLNDAELFKLRYRAVGAGWVIASQPVGTDTTGWEAIPPKSMGIFTASGPPEFVTIYPPPDPSLVIDSLRIDDDNVGESHGNGDGDCDAGERIELVITLLNEGYETAVNSHATLTTADTLCQVLDAEELYGDIPGGGTLPCQEDFDICIDPACPDGHHVSLTLTVECDGPYVWERSFDLEIHAPVIAVEHYVIDDVGTGNGNGRIEPGEHFRITTTLVNRGPEPAGDLVITLGIPHPQVSILQARATLDTLPTGGVATPAPPFEVALGSGCPAWDVLYGRLTIQGKRELNTAADLLMPVGGFYDDVEAGQGGWTTYVIDPEFVNQWHRSSARNYTPGGGWSWKFGSTGTGHYANSAAGALESGPVPLHAHSYLRFRHWMEAEASVNYPGYCYDGGFVELSTDGTTWQQIFPVGGYPLLIRNVAGAGPFPPNMGAYSGNIVWEEALFEIHDYSGTGRFRFVFGTDGGTTREGWYIDNVEFFGGETLWAGSDDPTPLILHPALGPSRPNPGPPGMRIQFDVPARGAVGLDIYDVAGRRVRTLVAGTLPAGRHDVTWDGRDQGDRPVAAGTYFYRLSCAGVSATHRLVLVR
jgi:predicted glutamine amidotransferase